MNKAERDKKFYLIMALVGVGVAILFTLAAVLFLVKFLYVPSVIFSLLSAYGYYSAPFCFFAYFDAREALRLIPIVKKHGEGKIAEISEDMHWRETATVKFLAKCKKRGYIA